VDSHPLAYALERIGDRWTLQIVDALGDGPRKFGEIQGAIGGIAPTVLTKRLRQLEADGIVAARPYHDRPVRVMYELTSTGAALAGAVQHLREWGAAHVGDDTAPAHDACGTTLETRWWCPSCEVAVDAGDVDRPIVI
jgi:DNA-binding HxlR family transcriptional regulator